MAIKSNDTDLNDLLTEVEKGKLQLPDFQRNWVWDDSKICKLIESITSGFPMGAAMFLDYGGDAIKFKYRLFTGVDYSYSNTIPNSLVLDGQQRLTTLYQVFKSLNAVETSLPQNRDKKIYRYYYLDIKKSLNPNVDRLDAIISISDNKIITTEIGRNIKLDLTSREQEYKKLMFPLNITFNVTETNQWMLGLLNYYKEDSASKLTLYTKFQSKILQQIQAYKIPVISLSKDTTPEAVCQIFENVNTGGVVLTVFELVTAKFAAYGAKYNLRETWSDIKKIFISRKDDLLIEVSGTNFITSMTLLVSYINNRTINNAVSCKKRDVLRLDVMDFYKYKDDLVNGFMEAANFMAKQGIYASRDLPYSTQYIPLAAIFSYDRMSNNLFTLQPNLDKLSRWYWCGVFGEMYGSANEARWALDITGIFNWLNGGYEPDTVSRSSFEATRLLTLQTRNSAAYKGVMALILQDMPLDFMTGSNMNMVTYLDESTDIHHIFPQAYCISQKYPSRKWNSIINKTPIYASTNRSIGGRSPKEYIQTMRNKGLTDDMVDHALESHHINALLLKENLFEDFIIDRAKKLLNRIEKAIGKSTSGRDSEDTIKEFGCSLK